MENTTTKEDVVEGNIKKVTGQTFKKEVLESEKTVLIDFYADWCGPCKILSPIIKEIAEETEKVKVVQIDVDEEEELAMEYGIMSIPTMVVIKDGEEVERRIGVMKKEAILEMLSQY
ncbi:MAG TPA: thioredoxin [Candidatus Merdicola faecigallinarum]|uniref:Thioredoxin n=1 Tax=Candidatus Merdicola faecigallinarum TaxID=2840862 RepID=A0A9D1M1U2_9FIRM|nr:thioredoxin [Candidatus Merdicola faecigallinarum]